MVAKPPAKAKTKAPKEAKIKAPKAPKEGKPEGLRRVHAESYVDSLPRRIPEVVTCSVLACDIEARPYEEVKQRFGVRVLTRRGGEAFVAHQVRCKKHRGPAGVGLPTRKSQKPPAE